MCLICIWVAVTEKGSVLLRLRGDKVIKKCAKGLEMGCWKTKMQVNLKGRVPG